MGDSEFLKLTENVAKETISWERFFHTFMPTADALLHVPFATFSSVVSRQLRKQNICCTVTVQRNLLAAIDNQHLCPKFKLQITARHTPNSSLIALYPRHTPTRTEAEAWGVLDCSIVVSEFDILDDHHGGLVRLSKFIADQLDRQHRTFIFTVTMTARTARLLRWDRAGVIASDPTDYLKNPTWLAEFLWRYNKLWKHPEARGFDPNAVLASYVESRLLTDAMRTYFGKVKGGILPLIPHTHYTLDRSFPAYKIQIADQCDLIVRGSIFSKTIFGGVGTRGYLAYHVQQRRLVFLKDFWDRSQRSGVCETEMYEYLHALHVSNIPSNLFAGPVSSPYGQLQHTLSQRIIKKYRRRIHTRIVQDLLYPLDVVRNSRQLVQAVRDALQAIDDAFCSGNVVHADVSAANIMINLDGRGILNDWDNSSIMSNGPHMRVGTWQYMSCDVLQNTTNEYAHHVKDDIESCFWVLLSRALMFFLPRHPLWDLSMFKEQCMRGSKRCGGLKKFQFLTSIFEHPTLDLPLPCLPLRDLILAFRELLGRFYIARDRHNRKLTFEEYPESQRLEDEVYMKLLQDAKVATGLCDKVLARHDWLDNDVLPNQFQEPGSTAFEQDPCVTLTSCIGLRERARLADILRLAFTDKEPCAAYEVRGSRTVVEQTSLVAGPWMGMGTRMVVGGMQESTQPVDFHLPPAYIGRRPRGKGLGKRHERAHEAHSQAVCEEHEICTKKRRLLLA